MKKIIDVYPIMYLEHGHLFRKDHNIIFKDKNGISTHIPSDSFIIILLGTGVNLSSNAVSHLSKYNCFVAISSSDYCPKVFLTTFSSIGSPKYSINQINLYSNRNKKFKIAKELVSFKFENKVDFSNEKSTNELMLKEARLTKKMYKEIFGKGFIRNYERTSDDLNKRINIANNALYNYCSAIIHVLGLCNHIGFLHGQKRNALSLDLSEYFKNEEYYRIIQKNEDLKEMLKQVSSYVYLKHKGLIEWIINVFCSSEKSKIIEKQIELDKAV